MALLSALVYKLIPKPPPLPLPFLHPCRDTVTVYRVPCAVYEYVLQDASRSGSATLTVPLHDLLKGRDAASAKTFVQVGLIYIQLGPYLGLI